LIWRRSERQEGHQAWELTTSEEHRGQAAHRKEASVGEGMGKVLRPGVDLEGPSVVLVGEAKAFHQEVQKVEPLGVEEAVVLK
jgi:hypothetical protein